MTTRLLRSVTYNVRAHFCAEVQANCIGHPDCVISKHQLLRSLLVETEFTFNELLGNDESTK